MINAIKFSIEEIEASDQYFDHTGNDGGDQTVEPIQPPHNCPLPRRGPRRPLINIARAMRRWQIDGLPRRRKVRGQIYLVFSKGRCTMVFPFS